MITYHDIQLAMRSAMQSGNSSAWALANGGKDITVLLGDRAQVRAGEFPVAIIIYTPSSLREVDNARFLIVEDFIIDIGTHNTNPEAAIAGLAAFEAAVYQDLLADRTLGGLVTDLTIVTPVGDMGVNHPQHFMGLKIQTTRKAVLHA
ncbi:hypothetical protein [Mariprofundus ferrooxydans]|uniref:hypothetical protein n=1 Tax=Mariprofundus ferrooxydans TaxID=314344 RepID=UPI00143105D6|nr:hypothetical protein [Mariprofundus ferrooxydans]